MISTVVILTAKGDRLSMTQKEVGLALLTLLCLLVPAAQADQQPPLLAMSFSSATRLLVVAPHPDDETLGAGGLIQRVHENGGVVKVLYLTDGEGYPEGVQVEDHVESPSATDYRGYGKRRRHEALAALHTLGLDS